MIRWLKLSLYFSVAATVHVFSTLPASGQRDGGTTRFIPANPPRIKWNAESLTLIQPKGFYARIIRLKNGQMICSFEYERSIHVRFSDDDGKSWQEPIAVAEWPLGQLTNAELLQLGDGTLLCFFNYRPIPRKGESAAAGTPSVETPRYAIGVARSPDNGKTWGTPEVLYRAGAEFENGCWEPAAIQLPSGEVQMFFSSEGPYRSSDEQEITLMRSFDGGYTWTSPERVSFRPKARDGMPVPLILKDRKGIAFSIEDNGLSGNFKPVIVYTSAEDNWRSGVRGPEHAERWSALRDLPEPHVAASAPYLRQMPSGETLLSFQRSDTGDIRHAYMVVCIGNANARDFHSPTQPFPITEGKAQLWNSLFVKDRHTVMAVTEGTINGTFGIWSVEGKFLPGRGSN